MKNKYNGIYQELANRIKDGMYQPLEKLPSEHELVEEFEVSRETIRKALNLLAQNGYIQKVRGKGSVVLEVGKFNFPISGLVSFKELANKLGKESSTKVHELSIIHPDRYLMNQLKANEQSEIWKVVRVRKIDNDRIILDKDYFLKKFVPSLTKDICEDSIYEYLEKELNIKISFAKKEFFVEQATEEDKELLDLQMYDSVVVVKNYVYLNDASLFQYTESRHRPDKFRFVDFARRQT
ncbi:trehalose operon repressor [Bacillus solimangrovi]|uniref:Trehalose operon repressor n=1 Tax=Bacillus solimangrovi TaxID=1305675 RepID=A0A1E5LB60_9BACI|nr:trehalose operon repressor [Bacillus solimangrovi]OEH91317.1 trehalose operon repressor [Bacillus solimangrovi]